MKNEQVVPEYIENYVRALDQWRVATAGPNARLTLVGDISTHVLFSGNSEAAMEIEHVWNDVTETLPFLTVCCYPLTAMSDDTHVDVLPTLCAEHFAVAHTPEGGALSPI